MGVRLRRRRGDEHGASAAEYAILVSLIAIVILVAVTALGVSVRGLFDRSCHGVATATSSTTC